MGMGIGINTGRPDAGEVKGCQEPIACGVWFTSSGRAIPKAIKFQDPEGELHVIPNIHIISQEEKCYCGIPAIEYECDTVVGAFRYLFRLLYYVERREWKILWNGRKRMH